VIAALAGLAIAGFALPHVLRLHRVAPVTAAVIWTSALALRGLTVLLAAAWLVLFFPDTHAFAALTHWCWHHLLETEVNGHDVGHVTTLIPALVGLVSLVSLCVGTFKLGRALHLIGVASGSRGPSGSVVIGGRDVVLAVAGLRHPRVLVSTGALLELDDDELDAALAHERAHIERRHRFVLVFAELCRALAAFLPGSRRAVEELSYHLERDADQYALERRIDRQALAGALRKASQPRVRPRGLVMALGGRHVEDRVDEILGQRRSARRSLLTRALAATMVALTVGLALALPPVVVAGVEVVRDAPAAVDCD
jgi:Zn-dependent protease with chaperone function